MRRRDLLRHGIVAVGAAGGGAAALASARPAPAAEPWRELRRSSYAEQGEDLILLRLVERLRLRAPVTYIDLGAYHPVHANNTYLLYQTGARGVLVEPNPAVAALLRSARPGDVTVEVGIAPTTQPAADYYLIGADPALNTFSRRRAETCGHPVTGVIKRALVGVNELLARHFDGHPNVFSIDIEGLDYEVLRALDFGRFRPEIVCVETDHLLYDSEAHAALFALMRDRGYAVHGGTFINTVFLCERHLERALGRQADRSRRGG